MSIPVEHHGELVPFEPARQILRALRGGAEPVERPTIRIGLDVVRVADDGIAALASDPHVYQRDGALVRVVRVPEDEQDALALAGTPQIRALPLPTLRERLALAATWERLDKRSGEWAACLPPPVVIEAVMARGEWRGVRVLGGVAEAPTLRPDGSVLCTPGYDTATALLYDPGPELEGLEVPEHPTQPEASAALCELAEPFAEFAWSSPAGPYVAIAAILTILARPAIRGSAPGFGFDASTRGSGKTLVTDVCATIPTGRGAARAAWPGKDDELEKKLGALALRGAALVSFDNLGAGDVFGGPALDRCLTATDKISMRVLGQSHEPELSWRAVVFASGNNLVIGGDTSRRVLVARLEPDTENPEERTGFRHPDLLGYIRRERARLVRAALVVLRGYVAAGRPDMGLRPWGSFEAWSALVPAAIRWAGGEDVMACRPTVAGHDDDETAALRTILGLWGSLSGSGGLTVRDAVDQLYSPERLRGQAPPDGYDELRGALETLAPSAPGKPPGAVRLGQKLRGYRGRVVGGRRLESADTRGGIKRWRVLP